MSSVEYWLSEIHTDVRELRSEVGDLRTEVSEMRGAEGQQVKTTAADSTRRRIAFEAMASLSTLGLLALGVLQIAHP